MQMSKKSIGAKVWLIADSYLPDRHNGDLESHESACVLNVSRRPAKLKFTIYFEDREPLKGLETVCPAERTTHVRLKSLKNRKGEVIPIAKPMAYMVESNVNVVVQHTRLDTSQTALALMTTIGYPAK
jgi:hypothetical protein